MTRSTLSRTLRRVYVVVALTLLLTLFAKIADHLPGLAGTGFEKLLKDLYEFLRDMSLLIATAGVAYITNVFQKRSSFLDSLKAEWRDIIATKSALFAYTQLEKPTEREYVATFCKVSETIDNMRSVYRNVGETSSLIGLYPYAPLHDMRRALQTLDPRKSLDVTDDQRRLVRDAILQSFYALRETFLEELDLEAPDRPLLIFGARRLKQSGATMRARRRQDRQRKHHDKAASPEPAIDELLTRLYDREAGTAKPWRQTDGRTEPPPTPRS
ncbi:MAG: hypothetical protein KDJ41_04825 [Hyphomicrobiaceae bacterium]|nr:hypothetical protein [Hyphomicrobiaceae bacterium]